MTADLIAVLREAFEAGYSQGHDATVEGRYSDPSEAASDYLADCSALSAPEPMGWRPIADCAGRDTAPTTAVAGVTEAMVETFEAKFLECARTRPDSTLRDDIRAALVAALGARKGE